MLVTDFYSQLLKQIYQFKIKLINFYINFTHGKLILRVNIQGSIHCVMLLLVLVTRSTFLPFVVLVRSLKVLIGSLAVLICPFVYRYPLVVFVCSLGVSDCCPFVLLVCSFFCPLVVLVELSVSIFKTDQWKQIKFNFKKLRVPKLFDYFNEI